MRKNVNKKYKDYMILIRDIPAEYYVARTGKNGLPIIENVIDNVPYLDDGEELSLTEKEFVLYPITFLSSSIL